MGNDRPRVLNVGQCMPDHFMISSVISQGFNAEVEPAHTIEEALSAMQRKRYALVLVNRIIDSDGSEGIELIRRSKADPGLADVPVMMISNHADAHEAAVAVGGVAGFGKGDIRNNKPRERLAEFLSTG